MIISHNHKYLFLELPRTGSTAIARELRRNYDGVQIMRKHSTYHDFLRIASDEEKKYFSFSCIRNPLDDTVSRYFKLITNHRERFTDPKKQKKRRTIVERLETNLFNYVQRSGADFPKFFMNFYIFPYENWASLSHHNLDFIIRFENIEEDFEKALKLIGLEPKQPLPVHNKTSIRRRDYYYYYTPKTIERAKMVYGPFMEIWGYQFPPEWGDTLVTWWPQLQFDILHIFRIFYWNHLRYRI